MAQNQGYEDIFILKAPTEPQVKHGIIEARRRGESI